MKGYKEKVLSARKEAIAEIKKAVESFKNSRIDLGASWYGNCPIVEEGDDDWDTYTLDSMYIEDGVLKFDGSSSDGNGFWDEDSISTDALLGIADELESIVDWCRDYEGDEDE